MAWQESIDLTRRVWELPPGTRRDELMGRWQEAFEAISEEQQTVTAAATQLAERVETLTQSITQALADSA